MSTSVPDSAPTLGSTEAVDPRQRTALLLALALILIWGSNFTVQKAVFSALSPGGFLFVRYLIMPLCAVLLLWQRYGVRWPRLPREEWWKLARLALIGHVLHVGMVTFGIDWSTAFSSSLILACGPVFTLLFLRWAGLEHLTRAQIAGVAVACIGVLIFLSDKLLGAQWRASRGDLVLLVAAAFFSAYTVAAKPLFERHGSVLVMTYTTLLGSAPLVLLTLPAGVAVDWAAVPVSIWAGLAYSVVLSAFVGWIVWGWINAVRGVARTAPLMYLMPPVAGLVAWLATGEGYTPIKLGGAAITLLGVALAQFAHRRSEPLPESVTVVD
ncbi:MAG TPA: DMT family transporter [Burkholderiaceae bacterium]|nr:DMT family transporter [Burkholderiaceae bacterium]